MIVLIVSGPRRAQCNIFKDLMQNLQNVEHRSIANLPRVSYSLVVEQQKYSSEGHRFDSC